jgi:hypothetical protein
MGENLICASYAKHPAMMRLLIISSFCLLAQLSLQSRDPLVWKFQTGGLSKAQ